MQAPISIQQAVEYARAAGFTGEGVVVIVSIGLAESSLVPDATNVNQDGSIDKGILQINNKYWPGIPEQDAFDPAAAFRWGFVISNNGTSYTAWVTFTNGAYKQYLDEVRAIAGEDMIEVQAGSFTAWTKASVRVRTGPGTGYDFVKWLSAGQALSLNAHTSEGQAYTDGGMTSSVWLRLAEGGWVTGHPSYTSYVLPEPYDALASDLKASLAEVSSLKAQVQKLQSDLATSSKALADAKTRLDQAVKSYNDLVEKARVTQVTTPQTPVTAASLLGVS